MKFVCLGYLDLERWAGLSEAQQTSLMDECFAHDEVLRAGGHFAAGEGLQGASLARTLRWKDGQVAVTDGPFAETKELLGGLIVLEARDMGQAVALMSKHPGVRMGPWEIRPVEDMTPHVRASEERRRKKAAGR